MSGGLSFERRREIAVAQDLGLDGYVRLGRTGRTQ